MGANADQVPIGGHSNTGGLPSAANHDIEALTAVKSSIVVVEIKSDVIPASIAVINQSSLFHIKAPSSSVEISTAGDFSVLLYSDIPGVLIVVQISLLSGQKRRD